MGDDKRQQNNMSDDQRSQNDQMGQKGGQAQSDYSNTNTGSANDTTSDTSLSDEDL